MTTSSAMWQPAGTACFFVSSIEGLSMSHERLLLQVETIRRLQVQSRWTVASPLMFTGYLKEVELQLQRCTGATVLGQASNSWPGVRHSGGMGSSQAAAVLAQGSSSWPGQPSRALPMGSIPPHQAGISGSTPHAASLPHAFPWAAQGACTFSITPYSCRRVPAIVCSNGFAPTCSLPVGLYSTVLKGLL